MLYQMFNGVYINPSKICTIDIVKNSSATWPELANTYALSISFGGESVEFPSISQILFGIKTNNPTLVLKGEKGKEYLEQVIENLRPYVTS